MKAAVCSRYGSPETLEVLEVERPVPRDDEVLIRVRAAALNALDWHFLRGTPYIGRLGFGLLRPRITRPGRDVAGIVEAVGRKVARFKAGDTVFGTCHGAVAEYACASASALAMKGEGLTFEQAASIPVAGYTAFQGLRDKGRVQAGQRVLINGATGGVGTFTVQVAKWLGANVTAVCSTRNVEMVRSLGADRVIDYTRDDYTKGGEQYDLVCDNVGNHSLLNNRRVLTPKGAYLAVGVRIGRWVKPLPSLLTTLMLSPFVSQNVVFVLAKPSPEDLNTLQEVIAAGKVTPVIEAYRLSEAAEAMRYLASGHARGKIVITVD